MPHRFIKGMYVAAVVALLISRVSVAYPYRGKEVHDGGTISGFVKYEGFPPVPAPLEVTKDREVCGNGPVFDQSLLVGHDRGVANVVVTLPDIAKGEPLKPGAAVRFDQKGCQYTPHVVVFPAGSTIEILNSDGILHNIHTESTVNPVIDLAQPGFKKQIHVTIEKPEIIKVTCDVHNWMEGWWYVTANPYYAITDAHGHFEIRDVPPGTYTLRAWQERLGTKSQRIEVRPGATTAASFTFRPLIKRGS
jgi:plastocyanin